MADLAESAIWEGVYQMERTDPLDAGVGGNGQLNLAPKNLANRTFWLRQKIENLGIDLNDAVAQLSFERFLLGGQAGIAQGRLTLQSNQAIPTGDRVGANATSLFYTPYNGNLIGLYNTSKQSWEVFEFAQIELSLAALTANTNYDIFLYDNNGVLTLETIAWSSHGAGTSARNVSLARQNGIFIKSTDARRYLGTIRMQANGQCEQSLGLSGGAAGGNHPKQFVWNAENRRQYTAVVNDSTGSWTYNGAIRNKNNSANNRFGFVVGTSEGEALNVTSYALTSTSGASNNITNTRRAGFGLNQNTNYTIPNSGGIVGFTPSADANIADGSTGNRQIISTASFRGNTLLGYNWIQEIEFSDTTGSVVTSWTGGSSSGSIITGWS
ncbi:hypothetical protein ACQ4M4_13045 [Leptolyngbya sp. AN02str]|uniref:hypothetical protein n=1 Tax=Leptolyngbya sp. AN02str TaxID=3423363 RepID=UPI003D312865